MRVHLYIVLLVQIVLLKPYSFANTELDTDENVESVSEKLEQLKQKFSGMKTNFQTLEISNLKVKLEIYQLNEKFQGECFNLNF